MHIQTLRLKKFMSHDDTLIQLPERGLVVVTGPNGAGKSSIIEAPAMACWGETLRGTSPWREGEAGAAVVITPEITADRARKGVRTSLSWTATGQPKVEFETTTKAQEALERIIGTFNVWRRTHVFSSHDAAHFTLATDGERKRLLEDVLQLDKFDRALTKCRIDLKVEGDTLRSHESALERLSGQLEGSDLRLTAAKKMVQTLPAAVDSTETQAEISRLQGLLDATNKDGNDLHQKLRAADNAGADLAAEARQVEAQLTRLGQGNCSQCGQPLPADKIAGLRERAEKLKADGVAAVQQAKAAVSGIEGQMEELREEKQVLERKIADLRAKLHTAAKIAEQIAATQKELKSAEESVTTLRERIAKGTTTVAAGRSRVAVLEASEQVLGLKGVRAHVLGQALKGIEQVANAWLARIAGTGLQLSLKSYSEKKTGGVSDAISLDVHGAGGGLGYRASSGGERRRIDVALLLALAEVSSAAQGRTPGTMFFDEVFDALDDDGVAAVRDVLVELCEERAVVVITHSKALIDQLPADVRLNVPSMIAQAEETEDALSA